MQILALVLLLSQAREPIVVSGEIVRVEARSITLTVHKEGKVAQQIVKVDKDAEILIDGAKGKFEDLKPGRAIRAQIKGDVAVKVETEKAAPKAPEKPAPKAEPKPEPKPEVKPPPPARPFPIDESVVPKGEKLPDLGGRVLSVFPDGTTTLVTIRQVNEEIPFYLPKDATVTYVGLEKPDQNPTVGYLVYVWLKPGSKETASAVRFARPR